MSARRQKTQKFSNFFLSVPLLNLARRSSVLMAVEVTLSVTLSFYLGWLFGVICGYGLPHIGGLWSAISAVLIIDVLPKDALKSGITRLLGSLLGAFVALVVDSLGGYHYATLAISLFLTTILASFFGIRKVLRVASLTALVITAIGVISPHIPVWINVASRFFESLIGVCISILVVLIFTPLRNVTGLIRKHDEIWKLLR